VEVPAQPEAPVPTRASRTAKVLVAEDIYSMLISKRERTRGLRGGGDLRAQPVATTTVYHVESPAKRAKLGGHPWLSSH